MDLTLDRFIIFPVFCLNDAHKSKTHEFFFLFAQKPTKQVEIEAKLNKLGCPLGCGEKDKFQIRGSLAIGEFFDLPEEEITQAFFVSGDSFTDIDLKALNDAWIEHLQEQEPEEQGEETEPIDLPGLEAYLKKWIVGQPVAIRKTMRVVRTGETGWRVYKHQPKGVVLLMGPTGTGKTELVRRVAMFFNKVADPFLTDDRIFIKLDMSEFMEGHLVTRITGASHTYVGFGSPTAFANVEKFETAIILLDEIEKAHPDVLNILLQIFEDGVLTVMAPKPGAKQSQDVVEKKIRFGNAYFFLSSNLGSEDINKFLQGRRLGFRPTDESYVSHGKHVDQENQIREASIKAMRKKLKPELVGRLDEVVVFYPLAGDDTLSQILDLRIEELQPTLEEHQVTLELSPEARAFLKKKGFDLTRGSRAIKNAVRKYVLDTLSQAEAEGKLKPGDHVVLKGPKPNSGEDDEGFLLEFEVKKTLALTDGKGQSGP